MRTYFLLNFRGDCFFFLFRISFSYSLNKNRYKLDKKLSKSKRNYPNKRLVHGEEYNHSRSWAQASEAPTQTKQYLSDDKPSINFAISRRNRELFFIHRLSSLSQNQIESNQVNAYS